MQQGQTQQQQQAGAQAGQTDARFEREIERLRLRVPEQGQTMQWLGVIVLPAFDEELSPAQLTGIPGLKKRAALAQLSASTTSTSRPGKPRLSAVSISAGLRVPARRR
jgi:hypothetical protein